MIDKSIIYADGIIQDAKDSCRAIFDLARIGLAANNTTINVDVTSALNTLFKHIDLLAIDAVARLRAEEKKRLRAPKRAHTKPRT